MRKFCFFLSKYHKLICLFHLSRVNRKILSLSSYNRCASCMFAHNAHTQRHIHAPVTTDPEWVAQRHLYVSRIFSLELFVFTQFGVNFFCKLRCARMYVKWQRRNVMQKLYIQIHTAPFFQTFNRCSCINYVCALPFIYSEPHMHILFVVNFEYSCDISIVRWM